MRGNSDRGERTGDPAEEDVLPLAVERRELLQYAGIAGMAGAGIPATISASEEAEYPEDDRGDVDDDDESAGVRAEATSDDRVTNPEDPPDGTIVGDFSWNDDGATTNEQVSDCSLEIEDDGGVDINFNFEGEESVTFECHWKHESGGELAYLFNDEDSTTTGFRAFTNGIAGPGLFFRNVFGGNDIPVGGTQGDGRNFQDGNWYQIRIVLDGDENTYTVYINDGDGFTEEGSSSYDGTGFEVGPQFRTMGRESGSSTRVNYDRYVMVNEAIHPPNTVTSDLLEYPLNECGEDEIGNEPDLNLDQSIERKQGLIDTIRADARDVLGEEPSELDARAESLLAEIDDQREDADQDERERLREALGRMNDAEELTAKSVAAGADQNGPLQDIAERVVGLGQILATQLVNRAGNSFLKRVGNGILSRLGSVAENLKNALIGRGELDPATVQRIEELVDSISRENANVADETDLNILERIGDTTAESGTSAGLNVAQTEGVTGRIDETIDGAEQELLAALFESYAVGDQDLLDPVIPVPAELEVPTVDPDPIEIPVDQLPSNPGPVPGAREGAQAAFEAAELLVDPDWLETNGNPKIDLEFGAPDIPLPEVPVLSDLTEIRDEIDFDELQVPAVGSSIDGRMENLEERLDELEQQSDEAQQSVRETLLGAIEATEDLAHWFSDSVDWILDRIDSLQDFLGTAQVLLLAGAALALVTGAGAVVLAKIIVAVTKLTKALLALQILITLLTVTVGSGFARYYVSIHHTGGLAIVDRDLGGVTHG